MVHRGCCFGFFCIFFFFLLPSACVSVLPSLSFCPVLSSSLLPLHVFSLVFPSFFLSCSFCPCSPFSVFFFFSFLSSVSFPLCFYHVFPPLVHCLSLAFISQRMACDATSNLVTACLNSSRETFPITEAICCFCC